MRTCAVFLIASIACCISGGCNRYIDVPVRVEDAETRAPIAGAVARSEYITEGLTLVDFLPFGTRLRELRRSTARTDADGLATVQLTPDADTMFQGVSAKSDGYLDSFDVPVTNFQLPTSAAAGNEFAAAGKWGGGWAKPGPASWSGGKPYYNPKNFEWGVQPGLTPIQKAGAKVHELTHPEQFVNQPGKVWHSQSWLPGSSVSAYSLKAQAYKAQAASLGESYRAWMPFQSRNMQNAFTRDAAYGGAAAVGAIWYFTRDDK